MSNIKYEILRKIKIIHLTDLGEIKQNGMWIRQIENQTEKLCLEAVRKNGLALKYVEEQTDEICFEAIMESEYVIKFVKDLDGLLEYIKEIERSEIDCVKGKDNE